MKHDRNVTPSVTAVRTSSAPRYSIVESTIRAGIENGTHAPGDKLPREVDLANQYGVSRSVIRHAIGNLERDGLVVRLRAKGTFITEPQLSVRVYNLCSFSEELAQRGVIASSRVLISDRRPLPTAMSEVFNVPAGTKSAFLERLRLGDDAVLGYDVTWVHPSVAWCVEAIDLKNDSLFEAYKQHGGRTVSGMEREVRARSANEELAEKLGVAPGSSVLEVHRLVRDDTGQVLDVQTRSYRGDRFSLRLDSPELSPIPETARARQTLRGTLNDQ